MRYGQMTMQLEKCLTKQMSCIIINTTRTESRHKVHMHKWRYKLC